MEVAGFTIGAIPLIVLTVQSYRLIRSFASEYNSYNKKLRCVLRDITVAGSLFKNAVNALLAEVIEEDTRDDMLGNPQNEYWERHSLNGDLDCVLGDLFEPVMCSIQGAQETLQEIKKLLLVLSGNKIPSKEKLPLKRLAVGVTAIATSVLKNDPLQLHFKNIQIKSSHRKLLSLAKDHRGELENLRNQLKEHNHALMALLQLAPYRKSRRTKSTKIHPISSPIQETGGNSGQVAEVLPDPKAIQTASQRLYRMASQALPCECHSIHLCLERRAKETAEVKDLKGKSKQLPPVEPKINFSFQLTTKLGNASKKRLSNAIHPSIHLVFTDYDLKDTDPAPEGSDSKSGICQEIPTSSEEYEKYFPDSGGPAKSCFILRRICAPAMMTRASRCTPPLSLDDLIVSRHKELRTFDRFLIAANLAYSLVKLYSSSWVRGWSPETIHFFEKQEQPTSTPGQWTPHLSVKFDHDLLQFGRKNTDIYSLGLMLLQLGRKTRLEPSRDETEELVLEKALRDLCLEMGPKYANFVRNCLASWSDRSMDLMKDHNLSMFLSHVRMLEEGAQSFNSP